jgi:hypothetical protein
MPQSLHVLIVWGAGERARVSVVGTAEFGHPAVQGGVGGTWSTLECSTAGPGGLTFEACVSDTKAVNAQSRCLPNHDAQMLQVAGQLGAR